MVIMADVKNYYCETCAISIPRLDIETGRACRLYNKAVKDTDFCSEHAKELPTCECCGNLYIGKSYLIAEMKDDVATVNAVICSSCNQGYNTCRTCTQGDICSFETDPSPLPKVVQKQIKQGNMTAVTQVMNPERVAITCQKDCPCWSLDFSCSKQNHGTCQQYHMCRA